MKRIKEFILKRVRLSLMKREYFYGTYAENLINIKRFVIENDLIVVHIHNEKLSMTITNPNTGDADADKVLIKEQVRVHSRELRKKHKSFIVYVSDNGFTRLLGFKRGMENMALR